ncbi:trehalose-6-phosphate phosphatase [Variibacter gotjawalensis]|uniref:Trehalose 6-phosphate phosphatase n=1 Tax=Variibacter gotjawalensis TaxID=1333996 RepID=A0A0S3PW62_9BRAD|nr:trehalose-phosphatase [Variibacter gotjawalensis]NIK45997.1 trehalose 6-phosphate phosphatase [Variibacter gotjawalensis]RZS47915.1 trehalose 6-phosphatase [Variibacter gotjawalensis]BAT60171.1 trehalose-6-phosphate phosphatase [Variibacter gotjawalensis]
MHQILTLPEKELQVVTMEEPPGSLKKSRRPMSADDFDHAANAILLDVDGTLIEFGPTPLDVHVPPSLKHTLSKLRDKLGGALCLVSGRPLEHLDILFSPLNVACIGGHGAENRLAPGQVLSATAAPIDPELRNRLLGIATNTPGVLAEGKKYSLALHYRLAPEQEEYIRSEIERICADFPADAVEVLPGKAVFEIKPRAFNKGVAVRALMEVPPFKGRKPIFLGDDVTDESVFSMLGEFNGIGYSVGRDLNFTEGTFATPREVRHWLYELQRGNAISVS